MKHVSLAIWAVMAATLVFSARAAAQNFGGPIGGGISIPNLGSIPGLPLNIPVPTFRTQPQRFRNLQLTGRVLTDQEKLKPEVKIVRLRVNGRLLRMRLDTELSGGDLHFDPDYRLARELHRAILTKRVEVVGEARLRDRIIKYVDHERPVQIEGYVFDRLSPYLVVRSVHEPH